MRALAGRGTHRISNPDTEGCQNVFHAPRDDQHPRQPGLLASAPGRGDDPDQSDGRGQHHRRPERLAGSASTTAATTGRFDGGKRWGDQVPPFWQFVLLDGHTADACSDPTVAWDSHGQRLFRRCLLRHQQRGERRARDEVERRRTAAASTTRPTRPAASRSTATPRSASSRTTTANEFANDKELMTADSNPSSPKQDNVYMTWTRFNADEPQPDLLQPVDGRRGDVVGSDRDQRLRTPNICTARRRRVQRRPGLKSGRRAGRHDLRLVRERQRAGQLASSRC